MGGYKLNTNLTYSTGLGTGEGNQTLVADSELCTLETCDLSMANFLYLPTRPGNITFAAVFVICLVAQLYLGVRHKIWGYMIAMLCGLLLEIVGYVARVLIHNNPFNGDHFLMSLITLTIAPAFLTAAIYICLSRIIIVYGQHIAFMQPKFYTWIFVVCDVISLMLQSAGGALASTADDQEGSDLGKNIMIAGLGFQVVSLLLYVILCLEFAWRVRKANGRWNSNFAELWSSKRFMWFRVALGIAVLTILIRSIYRCIELQGGFNGELFIDHEETFMILEGAMISIAVIALTVMHPAIGFRGRWAEANFKMGRKDKAGGKGGLDLELKNTGYAIVQNGGEHGHANNHDEESGVRTPMMAKGGLMAGATEYQPYSGQGYDSR